VLFCTSSSISPRNSEPNPKGNEYAPRNKDNTQKCLHYRLKTLNPLTMTTLKPWFGYILCIVSIIESKKRNIGEKTACQQCSIFPPTPSKQSWQTNANLSAQHHPGRLTGAAYGTRIRPIWHKIESLWTFWSRNYFFNFSTLCI